MGGINLKSIDGGKRRCVNCVNFWTGIGKELLSLQEIFAFIKQRDYLCSNKNTFNMAMNEYVLVSPQVTNEKEWLRGQIIDIEDNPFRGKVITVRLDNGNIYWDVEDSFRKLS